MKEFKPLFLITYILVGVALLSFSCNSTKTPAAENYTLMITLKDKLSVKYINSNYQTYSPNNIKRSNKTLNQYEVVFSCNNANYIKLQDQLANDSAVIKFNNQNSTNKIQSGTNDKFGKSKPIRDQK